MTHPAIGAGSLTGVVVLDLSHVLAGPYAAQTLADLGATVVKIENPSGPDVARGFPPRVGDDPGDALSGYYAQFNRGKRGLALDLREDAGRQVLKDLVAGADVLVENFRPGTLDKLGVGYDVLREVNPRLVYTAISGYGRTASRSRRPAFDSTAQAAGGIWSMTGYPGQTPVRVGPVIGDLAAMAWAVIGTLAALRHAERTGEGQVVDIAQVDSILAMTETAVVDYTTTGAVAAPAGNEHPWVRPYGLFPCKDGHIFFGGYTDKLWALSCEVFGTPEAAADPAIATMAQRFDEATYRARVEPLVRSWFADRTRAELEELAGDLVPLTPILDIGEVVDSVNTAEREMVVSVDYADLGPVRIFGSPLKLSRTPPVADRRANALGEHTDEVLRELAGYDEERIAALRAAGAVAG